MKQIITALFILLSFTASAQSDSTKVYNLQLQARTIEYIAIQLLNTDNDSLFQVYVDLRPKFRVNNPPSGNTLVTIDSIPTVELANLYNYVLSNSEGMSQSNLFKGQIATARTTNAYLNRLCTGYEDSWSERATALRRAGRKILRGKN